MNQSDNTNPVDIFIDALNLTGGLIFVIALIFQLVKMIKTKSTGDISLPWAILMQLATTVGLVYGIYYVLWPIYIATGLQSLFGILIIIFKLKYK